MEAHDAINRPNRHLFPSSLAPDIDAEIRAHIEMRMEDSLVALHTSFRLEGILHEAFCEIVLHWRLHRST